MTPERLSIKHHAAPDHAKWGLLPQDIAALLVKREWSNTANLKSRLLGTRPFPIRISLKAPDGRMAVEDLQHFQKFVESWTSYPHQKFVEWETKSYRSLLEQRIPRFFRLDSIQDLIIAVGKDARARSRRWKKNMAPLLGLSEHDIYPVLVRHLGTIEAMPVEDCRLLRDVAQQLYANMGAGQYLRALPLVGVDTKFLEGYQPLISDLLDVMHGGEISRRGGLSGWLGCLKNPKGWICVRPLCRETEQRMGGFPILQLPVDVLNRYELPATNILVVENMQPGLGLPRLPDTIAVFGGGKNVAWMDAAWLENKRVAYWGDIDSWGLAILADVREKLPTVTPLMMDMDAIKNFGDRMVVEPEPLEACPEKLNDSETAIFSGLQSGRFKSSRLEQERLSPDYIVRKIHQWLSLPS